MKILFMSISGNTRSFVDHLQQFANEQGDDLLIQEISENTTPEEEREPFIVIVPTYLEGGNGVESGDKEILTEPLREYIEYGSNQDKLLGVIGSGNKNFGKQYCLTAMQYARDFNSLIIDNFELRGMNDDVIRIYGKIKQMEELLK